MGVPDIPHVNEIKDLLTDKCWNAMVRFDCPEERLDDAADSVLRILFAPSFEESLSGVEREIREEAWIEAYHDAGGDVDEHGDLGDY